jgi:hypothetical protein
MLWLIRADPGEGYTIYSDPAALQGKKSAESINCGR